MALWIAIAAVALVLLVSAYFTDRRSRRIRGRAGRVRIPGGEINNRLDLLAGEQLSKFDAGPSQARHARTPKAH